MLVSGIREALSDAYAIDELALAEMARLSDAAIWQHASNGAAQSRLTYQLIRRQREAGLGESTSTLYGNLPVLQFWDTETAPPEVEAAMATWKLASGSQYQRFNDVSAAEFISQNYGQEYLACYKYCHHPAMRSDYFRLAFLLLHGGIYIDADDILKGEISYFFTERPYDLLLAPFVRDLSDPRTVPQDEFEPADNFNGSWNYYFNNAPMLALSNQATIAAAWYKATRNITSAKEAGRLGSIHTDTGPTNLTTSLAYSLLRSIGRGSCPNVGVLIGLQHVCETRFFSYKNDNRNWRTNSELYPK